MRHHLGQRRLLPCGGTKAALEALIDSAPDYEGPTPPPPPEPGEDEDEPPAKGKRAKDRAQPGWFARCLVDEKGWIVANLANALIALRADPSFEGAFAFDDMAQSTMLMRPLPLAPRARPAGNGPIPRQACGEDFNQVQEWLQHQGLPRISRETVYQAVGQRAREWRFHPLREYLERI
jgi:predicted P-loop ATPase